MLAFFSFVVLVVCPISQGKDVLLKKPDCGHQIVDSGMELRNFAQEGEFPWVVLLKYDGGSPFWCAGSIISDRYVLTSAVCVIQKFETVIGVVLGERNLDQSGHTEEYGIEKIRIHEYFSSRERYNNIALIKLNATVKFSDYVKPICLPTEGTSLVHPGDKTILAEWDKNTIGERKRTKKVVVRRVMKDEECQQYFAAHHITINDTFLCTQRLNDYTFAVEDGSPLMLKRGGTWYQEGILSFGAPACGTDDYPDDSIRDDIPDGNVRVSKYIQWINEKLSEN